jgi:hypothetical protein
MSSSTRLRVVTTSVGCGPYPTPYPVRCRLYVQSHILGSDNWDSLNTKQIDNLAQKILKKTYQFRTVLRIDILEGFSHYIKWRAL